MQKVRILWADDEIEHLRPFLIFLEERGFFVKPVSNGADAIDCILEEKFDLVLLDEMMPGLDGLATLEEIKKINASLPIVMVTKNEAEGLMDKAIASQIADYLIKPINPNQIILSIKKIFQTDEIRQNRIGEEYSQFSAKINQKLFSAPDWNDWKDIYLDICRWDLTIDEINDPALSQMHFLEKRNCNSEFCDYIENNYPVWLKKEEKPILSFDVIRNYVQPCLETKKPVYFIILDCMRLDQYMALEPFISELFNIKLDLYFSILPTATPYSRNSIFSGLLPEDIAREYPEYWVDSADLDNSRNRNEHQLLDSYIKKLGYRLDPTSKYVKIYNIEEGNFVIRKVETWNKDRLIVLVYNFLDLLAHHRSKDQILQETIPNEQALRAFTKHWFIHSSLYETLKQISKQDAIVILSTDHGSIRVNRATQVIGDKETTLTVRYKQGKNLSCNTRHSLYAKSPNLFGLPSRNIVDNFIFAKDDYYFVYPNAYHQYQRQYNATYQHGGVSMEEMILPIATCTSKKFQ